MTATKPATGLPVLYPEPLPTEPRERLREELRRVRRSVYYGHTALSYKLQGVVGAWMLSPEGYYAPGMKHKGRKGPYTTVEKDGNYKVLDERTFPSEAEAWAWITEEHYRRVDADFPALVEAEARRCDENAAAIRHKLEVVEAEALAWRSWLDPVMDPRD